MINKLYYDARPTKYQDYHLHVPIVLKSGSLNFLETQGLSRPVIGLLYLFFILVMLLCLLSVIVARLIEMRAVYVTVPHGIWNYFFLHFMK